MSEPYPVPSYAAHIWLVGDTFRVGFPALPGFTQGHTVDFPATPKGLLLLTNTLRARNQHSTIGQRGELTKYQTERALAGDKRYNALLRAMHTERQDSEEFLKELGLL